jgi:enoyl-CoA hydratase/carnithine racemase
MTDTVVETDVLTVERRLPAAILTLNRPEQRNALSLAMMQAVTAELKRLGEDPEVRAIVIRGAGRIFSSGHDLRELVGRMQEDEQVIFDACVRMMELVQRVPQPVVAQVHGVAAAAGCQLVAACDLVVAGASTKFLTPGVRIGLFCSTPMVALSRAIGRKRALEMLLTGQPIDAATAADWGLVNRVVPDEELEAATLELVGQIAQSSPLTLRIGKEAFYRQIELAQADAYEQMADTMVTNAMTCDAQEGMTAFLEKRDAVWQGR